MSKEVLLKLKDSTGAEKEVYGDSLGNLLVSLATLIAGEDITNDLIKVEQRYSALNINTGVGTLVKTGSGYLKSIIFNNVGTAWEVDVYDGTSTSGTSLGKIRSASFGADDFMVTFSNGLYIDTVKGTTVGDLTVAYR